VARFSNCISLQSIRTTFGNTWYEHLQAERATRVRVRRGRYCNLGRSIKEFNTDDLNYAGEERTSMGGWKGRGHICTY
jgi:hypothetical protein